MSGPCCPVCGWECKTIVLNINRDPIGCDNCLMIEDAYFWEEDNETVQTSDSGRN